MRTGALLLLVLAMTACSPAADEPISDFLARTLPEGPGGTVIAARGDRIVDCEGFGLADRAAGTPAACDTVYDVMSITKQFTAAAILKLETMGRLRTSDPISAHLGQVPPGKQGITVHHLLTHTAGLPESLGDDYEVLSREGLLARALASAPLSAPGERFRYSNAGYSVLAAIIEKVSGLGYEEFLAEHLFAPAGMTSTGYVLPHWDRSRMAVEYDAGGRAKGRPDEHPRAPDGPYWNLRGNGGMLSTARDMFRWHRALIGDTVLPGGAKDKLFTPYAPMPDSDESYAYGWSMHGTGDGRIAWHDGGNSWSLASYARSLDDGVMTFWVSNHAYRDSRWNLEDVQEDLTLGILDRARASAA
ncbi:class A beta-lactamase-related serine hydrolase [Nonomuraea longispora]|uniref:Class A beta-lactamase-related serine hydrolase n=1 Tax=Nonomuraea longispora TaxID=1848320 RepID=A0A4R4ND66_9ACTN|nr:serine hydrolase domain-containing protein [Nonomuraea longispora]TDC06915.1 class A beta-lactamase-related serine hydrolase [Nonomuraea longispora]